MISNARPLSEPSNEILTEIRKLNRNAWKEKVLSLPFSFLSFTLTPDGFSLFEGIAALTNSILVEIREESINVFDLQSNQLLWIYDEQQDEIQHNQILNLSDEGDRWEGDVFHDSPYGWGLLYDSNNNKAYEGFRLGNVNAGYGRSYYSEIGKKEYEGQICNGKRWGRGTQYDRNEHEVFDGEWINDACLQSSVVFSNATQILHNHIEELTFSENCCNEVHLNAVAFDCFALLRTITIHSNSFKHPKQVKFQHMHCLESITVERNCFKETEKGFDKLDRTFICSDNPRLKSIHIDCMSFPEFRECIIHSRFTSTPSEVDLPSLEELQFGQEDKHSLCFYWSDCVLQDLPSLRSISLGPYCFYSSRHTVFESDSSPSLSSSDLPLLTSIQLGRFALLGDNHPSCDLTLRNLPSLQSFVAEDASFYFPRTVIAENIPNLATVNLPEAFMYVTKRQCKNCSLCLGVRERTFDPSTCVLVFSVS